MKRFIPFGLLFLFIISLSATAIAQSSAEPLKLSGIKVMVMPSVKAGEDLRTILANNLNLPGAIEQVKAALDKRGYAVQDFEKSMAAANGKNLFKTKAPADVKNAFIEYAGADIYIETAINVVKSGASNQIEVLLKAYDAVTAKQYANITCNSRERNSNDIETLVKLAIGLPVPPTDLYDNDNKNRSKIPCLDDFLNTLRTNLTDDIIKKITDKQTNAAQTANQENCQVLNARADHELLQHHYEAARAFLTSISQENGQCYTTAQQKIGDLFKQQFGSLDKASTYYQKEMVISPENESFRKNLNLVNKFIEIRNEQDKTPPQIILKTPEGSRGQDLQADVTVKGEIYVSGFAKSVSGVNSVSVNGKAITNLQPDGFFNCYISKDASDITIEAIDKKGNNSNKTYHIAAKANDAPVNDADIRPLSDDERFHAIFIANSDYTGGSFAALPTTVSEARSLKQLFISRYNFAPADVDTLFNKSRNEILRTLTDKLKNLTENDNVVIFYGGHGYYNKAKDLAYWVPLNTTDEFDYISNLDITKLLKDCNARHILIMADACFSGAMRGGVDPPSKYDYKNSSRQLLTSGGMEEVPGKSAYVHEILDCLKINEEQYLSAKELLHRIYDGIKSSAQTESSLITLNVPGSSSGQFYFKKR